MMEEYKILNLTDRRAQFDEILINENGLIGSSMERIRLTLGEPDQMHPDEWVYVLRKYCYGLFKQKLHLFYFKEKVRDYYIGI